MASALFAVLAAVLAAEEPTPPAAPLEPKVEAPAAPVAPAVRANANANANTNANANSNSNSNATPTPTPTPHAKRATTSQRAHSPEAPSGPFAKPPPPIDRHSPPEPLLDLPRAPARNPTGEPGASTPPTLAPTALRDELAAGARRRQEDLQAIARERARLEKLAADIAAARAALREETARLDERARKAEADRAQAERKAAEAKAAAAAKAPERPSPEPIVKTLKSMKPGPAAGLLARLDRRLAIDVLRRLRPDDASALLVKMKPEVAADLLAGAAEPESPGGAR